VATAGSVPPQSDGRKIFSGVGVEQWILADKLDGVRVDGGPPAAGLRPGAGRRSKELG
jgi:hypothetical protein